jgi:predicted ATP-grasp superfamily ATP-dependent carboligase
MIGNSREIANGVHPGAPQHSLGTSGPVYNALVLNASLRQALVTVRSLGRQGCAVAASDTMQGAPAFSSRWCRHGFICPESEAAYFRQLEHWLDHFGAQVLIPLSDGTIALIRQHREQLERYVRIALAKEPALTIAVNKEQTLEVAWRLGLKVPRGVLVKDVNDVAEALHTVGLPAVVKPVESWVAGEQQGMRLASQLVVTSDEAKSAVEELTSSGGTTLFQQFLSGRREALSFLYAHGKMYARFAQWAKRTEPPLGGQSILRQSIAIPTDIGVQAERLVREIALEGYSEVEFRRDATGAPYLMEINPRLSASVEIAVRSGVDFPRLLYQWAKGEPIETVAGYRIGGWMRYLKGDIMTTIEALQQRGRPGVTPPAQALLGFCLSFLRPMDYDYVDWDDPVPAMRATIDFTRSWVGGAMKKRLSCQRRLPRRVY